MEAASRGAPPSTGVPGVPANAAATSSAVIRGIALVDGCGAVPKKTAKKEFLFVIGFRVLVLCPYVVFGLSLTTDGWYRIAIEAHWNR